MKFKIYFSYFLTLYDYLTVKTYFFFNYMCYTLYILHKYFHNLWLRIKVVYVRHSLKKIFLHVEKVYYNHKRKYRVAFSNIHKVSKSFFFSFHKRRNQYILHIYKIACIKTFFLVPLSFESVFN